MVNVEAGSSCVEAFVDSIVIQCDKQVIVALQRTQTNSYESLVLLRHSHLHQLYYALIQR